MPMINTGTDEIILNFKNATEVYSVYSGTNHDHGLCNNNCDTYKIKALYAPKLTETITAFNGTYNRINPAFGIGVLFATITKRFVRYKPLNLDSLFL